jgi:hypothetical protein
MACSEVDGEVPELPLLPRIGEPTVRPGDTGGPIPGTGTAGSGNTGTLAPNAGSGGGGCSVGLRPASAGGWSALLVLLGLSVLRRNRRG